jgi:hypothetical protein
VFYKALGYLFWHLFLRERLARGVRAAAILAVLALGAGYLASRRG